MVMAIIHGLKVIKRNVCKLNRGVLLMYIYANNMQANLKHLMRN